MPPESTSQGRDLGRFFLESIDPPRLSEEDARHATRVLRASAGDGLVGLDGRGLRQPLEVVACGKRQLELRAVGEMSHTPPPGASGSLLPAIEVACAPPRPNRIEALVDRLTQLGVARIQFLGCRRTGPEDRRPKRSRLERVMREAAKQSGNDWLPELPELIELESLTESEALSVVAHPSATRSLLEELTTATDRLRSRTAAPEGQRPEPSLRLLIGPEGGFDEAELARLTAGGATPVGLGPTILRIETAAEAGSSLAVQIGTTQSP